MISENPKGKYLAVVLVILAGVVSSIILAALVYMWEQERLRTSFEILASDRASHIEDVLNDRVDLLYSIRGFYDSSKEVERNEFHVFTAIFLRHYRDIIYLAWIPRITDAELQSFEEDIRKEGYADFQITEMDSSRNLVKAPRRDEYFPVRYVEPFGKNEEIFGFDVASERKRHETLEKACDTGESCATPPVKIITLDSSDFGCITYMPIYEKDVPVETIEQRRQHLSGFTALSFLIGDMIDSAFSRLIPAAVDVALYDESVPGESLFLYFHKARTRKEKTQLAKQQFLNFKGMEQKYSFELADRKWTILCKPSPDFFSRRKSWSHWLVLLLGLALTGALVVYMSGILMRSSQLLSMVEERTRELSNSKEYAELLYRVVPSAIFTVDKNKLITTWNDKAAELTGYSAREAIGKECLIFAKDPCKNKCGLYAEDVSKPVVSKECTIRRKDGEMRIISKNVDYLRDIKNNIIGGIESFEDITERKEVETKLKETIKLKAHFISMVSHELRTPLTAIKETVDIISEELSGKLSTEQKDFVDMAKRNVDRLARLINNVLDFQKLESGKMQFSIEPNDLNEVINEVQGTMASLAAEKGLRLSANLDAALPKVNFDRDRITQVLTNIISNALKFTEKGSIDISSKKSGENAVEVSVRDTGQGIKKEDITRLFQKFEQLATMQERRVGGTGLGLAISKEIIEQHRGKIWAESELGRGTTVYFILPIKERRA
ncbi:MAG: CHASE domain-containing protein [Candidatus Omnitrophota bacterium]